MARASEYFLYELIPAKNTLSWTLLSESGNRAVYARLSGRIGFTVYDDGTITSDLFDLTIDGPLYDSLLESVDDVPFAAGDKLGDYLTTDFAATTGLAVSSLGFQGNPPPPASAYLGPQLSGDSNSLFLGTSYFKIQSLKAQSTLFFLNATARPDVGGTFSVFPPGEPDPEFDDGFRPPILFLSPNVQRVPEPSAGVLAAGAALAMLRATCRRSLNAQVS
ncbi:MAG: hypothetical protein KF847_11510 [Pirellulales bacterium]|nr:hypothetical protein [Pirellulales bacterium]